MALETGNYIGDLVVANPTPADPKSLGDDHFRLIKSVLRISFAGFAGAVLITGTDGGAANAYTLTPSPALPAYTQRTLVAFTPAAANTAGCTLNVSGLGAKALLSVSGDALAAGELPAGVPQWAAYDGTAFRLTSPTKKYVDLVRDYASQLAFSTALPNQSGNGGRWLTTDGSNASWANPLNLFRTPRTSNVQLVSADKGSFIDILSGTFTQTFDAPANLGNGWNVLLRNGGTGDITVPSSDGRTNWVMYPNEVRVFQCNGTVLTSVILHPFSRTITSSMTFVPPPGYEFMEGDLWGAGASGGACSGESGFASGAGAGNHLPFKVRSADLGTSVVVNVGAGGAAVIATAAGVTGNPGGNSSFGPLAAYGGGAGATSIGASLCGGSGAGVLGPGSAGGTNRDSTGGGPNPFSMNGFAGGNGIRGNEGQQSIEGGGSGAGVNNGPGLAGGGSVFGGGGGGSAGSTAGAGGASVFGGNGGNGGVNATGTAGAVPAGGGGGSQNNDGTARQSGAGARGECRIRGIV